MRECGRIPYSCNDTQFRGNLANQGAYVARSPATYPNNRFHPYRSDYRDYRPSSEYRPSAPPDRPLPQNGRDRAPLQNDRLQQNQESASHFGKRCYNCGGWNHIASTCWHARPELHPRNRRPDSQHAYGMVSEVKQEANVTAEPATPRPPSPKREHPFEFNMIMTESEVVPLQVQERHNFRTQLNLFIASDDSPPRRWLLDSGASSHYIKDPTKFANYVWLDQPVKIHTGSGIVNGVARGDVILYLSIGKVTVRDVLLVPDLTVASDLLSIPTLVRAGFTVNFSTDTASILKNGKLWAVARSPPGGGLFFIEEFEKIDDYALAMQCTDRQPFLTWHCHLGHINGRAIRSMATSGKVSGMEIGDPQANIGERNIDCADCLRGSQHQMISRYPFSPVSRKLARVSVDITGPMRVPDCTWAYRFLLIIIDHFTRYTWCFPLITKNMALQALRIFQAHAETHTGSRILTLQSDNGGEFGGKEFTKWTQDSGIEHITCAAYASSMNSYVERVIKSIITHASAMLWHAGVREDMWALAAKASVYLHNRVPNRSLPNEVTPYELWHGSIPHVGHIRVWGCRAWAAIPKKKRTKWDSKSAESILVGFYDTENLYQLWDVESNTLVKKRDVIFHEHVLGHPSLVREQLKHGWEITGLRAQPDDEVDVGEDDQHIEHMYMVIEDVTHCEMIVDENVPRTYEAAMKMSSASKWELACKAEHRAMISNDVYDWVAVTKGTMVLPSKWIFAIKPGVNGERRYKARIVAGGHRQRKGIDFKETFAPVAKFVSLRILLTLMALHDWEAEQSDIVTAFLHGDLEEVIYMRPPCGIYPPEGITDVKNQMVWKLKKSIYGLKQSPRCFYSKLDSILRKKGYIRVQSDYGVWVKENEVRMIAHVDDMLLLGTRTGIDTLKDTLRDVFKMKWMGALQDSVFVGLRIRRDREKRMVFISQEQYALEIVARFGLQDANGCSTPMEPKLDWSLCSNDIHLSDDQKKQYQAAIGSLIYLMLGSRPDLAFSINKLAQYSSRPTERHWRGVKRILRFVKRTTFTALELGDRQKPSNPLLHHSVIGYFDAAYMDNTADSHSTMGYLFLLYGSTISWASKKQQTIALSTTEAEYLAGTEATKECMWIIAFLGSLGIKLDGPVKLLGDNQGANALAKNPTYHARTKHIGGRQRFLSEMVEQRIIEVSYIPTADMAADTLTKALPRDSYDSFMSLMGLHSFPSRGEVALMCSECLESFRSRNTLHRHIRNKHQGPNMKEGGSGTGEVGGH